jgi:hypothetical protein
MYYPPTYSSWLNQVKSWLARIERDCIAREIFPSTVKWKRKLMRFSKLDNETARSYVWRYRDPQSDAVPPVSGQRLTRGSDTIQWEPDRR